MTKAGQDGGLPPQLSQMQPTEPTPPEQKEQQRQDSPLPQMPREMKYAWGVAMTVLVTLSLLLDRGSAWMPLIHKAIDALQVQTAPNESK
jgi:hypothetical protein